jgi:transcriptional regulator with XRE-family HTH domain
MPSIGERLKRARESRDTSLDEMAAATGIGKNYLEALERDQIGELPGKAFGKLYIRAYAEILEFDPQPWIEDYDREQRMVGGPSIDTGSPAPAGARPVAAAIARWKAARLARPIDEETEPAEDEPEPEPEPVEPQPLEPEQEVVPAPELAATSEVAAPKPKRRLVVLVAVCGVAIAVAIFIGTRRTSDDAAVAPPGPPASATSDAPQSPSSQPAAQPEPQPQPPPRPSPPSPARAAVQPPPPGTLSVTEYGVGRRVANLRLEGQDDRFTVGTRVCFATRVLGGQGGATVRHVWLYEGKVEQSITLRLGARDYRTHSNKTLGHAGAWAVEARDAQGAVLARVEFTCVAAS